MMGLPEYTQQKRHMPIMSQTHTLHTHTTHTHNAQQRETHAYNGATRITQETHNIRGGERARGNPNTLNPNP